LLQVVPKVLVAQKTYAFAIAGGAAVPVGQFGDVEASGYNGTVAVAIGSADVPVGVRFDGIYNHFSRKDVSTPPGGVATADARIAGGLVNLIFAFPGTTAKAYFVAGVGYYNTKAQVSGAKADNNIGYNGGVGITFGSRRFATFVETRYHGISRSAGKGGVIHFVPVTIGLLF
jgi:hypothetical protein